MKKRKLAVIFGGVSNEHDISLMSTKYFYSQTSNIFDVELIYISKEGGWYILNSVEDVKDITSFNEDQESCLTSLYAVDYVFPIVHGNQGEDGQISGFLDLMGIKNLCTDTESSSVCFNKKLTKVIAQNKNVPVVPYWVKRKRDFSDMSISFEDIEAKLGTPFVIKPNRSGSSFGVSKVSDAKSFELAVHEAFKYDYEIIFEKYIQSRELSCVILGNSDNYLITEIGEDDPKGDFNTYEVKYFSEKAELIIPANIDQRVSKQIQEYSLTLMKELNINGFARYDFFLNGNDIYLNEINTCPGMTSHSLFPLLLSHSHVTLSDTVNFLIENYG